MCQRNETTSFMVQMSYLDTVEKMKQNFSCSVTRSLTAQLFITRECRHTYSFHLLGTVFQNEAPPTHLFLEPVVFDCCRAYQDLFSPLFPPLVILRDEIYQKGPSWRCLYPLWVKSEIPLKR